MTVFWIVLGAVLFFGILPTLAMSYAIFCILLKRTKPEKWGRTVSMPEDEQTARLYADAEAWDARWAGCRRDLEIRSFDGLRLAARYYDFGGSRAVIIVPGRMESCLYSCHYAEPYRQAGCNVLCIDNRAHGESEGKYNHLGYKEYRDVLDWAALLHRECGCSGIWLHGLCIGCTAVVMAAVSPDCPAWIEGVTVDGMYRRFYDSCYLHMKEQKRPLFPFCLEIMLWIRVLLGADALWDGPGRRIREMRRPILFLHSREDIYSLPGRTEEMYADCPSAKKKIVWFDHGGHSRVRLNNTELYDRAIVGYLSGAAAEQK